MWNEILGLLHRDGEPLLDRDAELDEIERVEADRAIDAFRQRGLHREIGDPTRVKLQTADENHLQLVQHLFRFHQVSFRVRSGAPYDAWPAADTPRVSAASRARQRPFTTTSARPTPRARAS